MMNPILLCEVAKLHHRETEREINTRQIANQAKTTKTARAGRIKRFIMVSFSSTQNGGAGKLGEVFSR